MSTENSDAFTAFLSASEAIRNLNERIRGVDEALVAIYNKREEWRRMHNATSESATSYLDSVWYRVFDETIHAAQSVGNKMRADLAVEHELLKYAQERSAAEKRGAGT